MLYEKKGKKHELSTQAHHHRHGDSGSQHDGGM
jgi:hypothetical protein